MKTTHGTLRKKLENNEPLFNIVTNENIGEVIHLAKLNGYDNYKIIDQLDRKSCKASISVRLSVILGNEDLSDYFHNKYISYNGEIRPGYLVKNFFVIMYRICGFAGLLNLVQEIDLPVVHKFFMEDDLLADELNALAEDYDTTTFNYSRDLLKLIELHESTK